jgi:hypothetical protein
VSEPKPAPCQSVFEYPDLFSIMHERKQQAKQGPSLRVRCTEGASLSHAQETLSVNTHSV